MYDVIVVGGGPAGLSAALLLGRSNRRVLVCDSGQYRNGASRAMHGFLSRDGTPPAELRRIGREQLAPYAVEFTEARVTQAARAGDGFTLALEGGARVRSRKLLLATGLVDELPPLVGLDALWGKSVFVCPYCDAWEVRGAPLAVHGAGGAALALSLLDWSDDVVLFTDGSSLAADEADQLAAAGVRVREERVARLVGAGGVLERVELVGGGAEPRRALFLKLTQRQRSNLAAMLAVPVSEQQGVETGKRESTPVPGLFVAGDASRDVMFAIVAAAEGATAGFAINTELQAEDRARTRAGASVGPTGAPRRVAPARGPGHE